MTYRELIRELINLPWEVQAMEAMVYPPDACPATKFVSVVGVQQTEGIGMHAGNYFLSTGKVPESTLRTPSE